MYVYVYDRFQNELILKVKNVRRVEYNDTEEIILYGNGNTYSVDLWKYKVMIYSR